MVPEVPSTQARRDKEKLEGPGRKLRLASPGADSRPAFTLGTPAHSASKANERARAVSVIGFGRQAIRHLEHPDLPD